jgi:hypothetical protein
MKYFVLAILALIVFLYVWNLPEPYMEVVKCDFIRFGKFLSGLMPKGGMR